MTPWLQTIRLFCLISQARILKWVTISSSRGSSWPRDQTCISCVSCIDKQILYHWATWEAPRSWDVHPVFYRMVAFCIYISIGVAQGQTRLKWLSSSSSSLSLCELPFRTSLIILHALRCAVKVDVNLFSDPKYGEMRTGFRLVEPENVSLPLKTLCVL